MTALFAEIKCGVASDLPLIEVHAELRQLSNALGGFGHNRPHHRFVTKTRTGFKRISYVQLERIFIARRTRDSALRPGRIRVGAFTLCDDGNRTVPGRFQCKAETGNATADYRKIVFPHPNRILSIKRVLPKKTATASSEFGLTTFTGSKVSTSTTAT